MPSPIGAPAGADLHLKFEHLQHTGSFKVRGAFNKLLALGPEALASGVVTASTGNHGAAVAYAAQELGTTVRVVVAETADPGKVAGIRARGAEVITYGDDSAVAEMFARRLGQEQGIPFISPYNDPDVVAGQGTLGVELDRQLPAVEAVFIALGGGGLLAGVAGWLKSLRPGVHVIGCSPENSAVMAHSLEAGRILELESRSTLSDGTAGGVEPGSITFPWCRELMDEVVLVSEEQIADAMRAVFRDHGARVEGAAGVAVAGFLAQAEKWRNRRVAVVLCGGNIGPALLQSVLRTP